MLPSNLLPDDYKSAAFIAGGFAAHQELASDIDLWVSVPLAQNALVARRVILQHLQDHGFIVREETDRRLDGDITLDHYGTVFASYKVGVVEGRVASGAALGGAYRTVRKLDKPIHILVTNGSLSDVLESFDLSTHQIAIPEPFIDMSLTQEGSLWTPINEQPLVLKDTPTTPARYAKLVRRYQHLYGTNLAVQHEAR